LSRPRLTNTEVARALREMSLFLEMDGVPFKPQAYEKAAYAVAALDSPLSVIYAEGGEKALDAVPGIGKGIAERIVSMLETGRMADLESLRKKTPVDVLSLTAIEGVGARTARALWRALGVRSVKDLRHAAETGRIRTVPRFGEKSEQRILEAIALYEEASGRRPLGEVLEIARGIETALARIPGVVGAAVAGSIRRHRETIGDVDILVAAADGLRVSRAFEGLPEVQAVLAHGPTKTLVRLSNGIDADLRVLAPESFGAALLYFTGSKDHNVALRKIARKKGLKLNEYGLFRGARLIAARTEEEVYKALGLTWIPPELREDGGEVELAQRGRLPAILEPKDIRGDLQVHTNWTDGSASIEAMARAARELGREYIAVTDHTRDLAMTGGLDAARLRAQMEEVRKVDGAIPGLRVLAGAEVNIRADGSLDLEDDVLAELDVVGAAVHSHFDQPPAEMTRRLVRAIGNPHVDILFHPLARSLGRRRPIEFDFDEVIAACLRTGTILEIDAQPERLDLPDSMARRAIEVGVRIAVDSDAHGADQLRYLDTLGVGVARRAWAESRHVVNALPADAMLAALKGGRMRRASPG
jgi:DNA polymerase (family 10)